MKIRIDASTSELRNRAPELVRKVAEALGVDLRKAGDDPTDPPREPLKHPYLRHIHQREQAIYREQMAKMLDEIDAVIKRAMK